MRETIRTPLTLAFFALRLLVEQIFQFLHLAVCRAQRRDVQEADLELEFGNNVHNPLYRVYDKRSIGM